MIKTFKYKHTCKKHLLKCQKIIVLFTIALVYSCSGSRHLIENEYLLEKSVIDINSDKLDKKEFRKYFRQSPNKKILGFKFHLFLYNLGNPDKDKFPHSWLRRIGEPPVIYDQGLKEKTVEQLELYLENKGYYYAHIKDTVKLKKKKAIIRFDIEPGLPYIIKNINYQFKDTSIQSVIFSDTVNSLLKPGVPFDKELIEKENNRIELVMRENGYYKFRNENDYVLFEAKRIANTYNLNLNIVFKQSRTGYIDPISKVRRHQKYIIGKVSIKADTRDKDALTDFSDTVYEDNIAIIYPKKQFIKPQTLTSALAFQPYSFYSISNAHKTSGKLSKLELFRLVNINFKEQPTTTTNEFNYGLLNCQIELAPRERQSSQINIEQTVSARDLGVSASYSYTNYNFFRGAEKFRIKLSGSIEAVERFKEQGQQLEPMREFAIVSSIDIPKFLLPFRALDFTAKYDPKSNFQLSYNYQDRPDYLRTIFNSSFGYYWTANEFTRHWIFPADFNYVRLDSIKDQKFWDDIKDTPLKNSFTSHTILGSRYGFEFTTQKLDKLSNYVYLRTNFESAGLLVNAAKSAGNITGNDSLLLGVQFYQYVKTDFDFRQYIRLIEGNWLVYRLFFGIGYPYGASGSLPFEKMYYSGGPYSIRAWNTRALGPGADTVKYGSYANNLGDLRLEANLEYRFDMFWKIEGALFLDAGNVWLIKNYQERPEAGFGFTTFYKQIAIGTGLGLRLDLGYFLLRFDFGLKLRDPSIVGSNKFVFNQQEIDNPVVFQFGIGYPF